MSKVQSIPPFPADEDRRSFAGWLTGFSDGESSFQLQYCTHGTPIANYTLALRKDDNGILQKIQSFWQCGRLYHGHRVLNGKRHFVTAYIVQRIDDLIEIIVPHFERFCLFSKKRHDFAIWREGAILIANRDRSGLHRRWAEDALAQFAVLHDSLREQRKFKPLTITE